MAVPPATRKFPIVPLLICGVVILALLAGVVFYFRRPASKTAGDETASADAKQYVSYLRLSDVSMKAAENFMQQQVVEVEGKITNNGSRSLESVDVFCVFYDVDGREIHKERLPIVRLTGAPLRPNETRAFRLPFDALPPGWNQALPKLVIAQIKFAS